MSKLMIGMGAPGAGKSTWIKDHMEPYDVYISRDEIRFSLLADGDDYFSREDEVWALYIQTIELNLNKGATVWVDATHLNRRSRLKLLHALWHKPDEIEVVYFKVPLEVALERNEQRAGRAYVPPQAIEKMYRSIEEPEFHEGRFTYNRIYVINENGKIEIKEEE